MRILWRENLQERNMANFGVDVLLKALDELQDEKSLNEQTLAENYGKRKRLESKVEKIMSMLSQTSEKHARILETMKMEEQRVTQTQGQINQFEQVNDGIRDRITRLNLQIKQTEEERQYSMEIFEEQMSQLIGLFRSSWKDTEESSLESGMSYLEEQKSKLNEQTEANERKLKLLKERIKTEEEQRSVEIIPLSELFDDVCKMFEAENTAAKIALEKQQEDLCLEDLEKELAILLRDRLEGEEPENSE